MALNRQQVKRQEADALQDSRRHQKACIAEASMLQLVKR